MDAGNTVDRNVYGVIPFYQETRYGQNGSATTAHGIYARNGMLNWEKCNDRIFTRSSSSALTTIAQFQAGCIGLPAMQVSEPQA